MNTDVCTSLQGSELCLALDSSLSGTHALLYTEAGQPIVDTSSNWGIQYREMDQRNINLVLSVVIEQLFNSLHSRYLEYSRTSYNIARLSISFAGLDERFDNLLLSGLVQNLPYIRIDENTKIIVRSIGEASHRAAFKGEPGLVIRCGAGASVFGANNTGLTHISNAWGYIGGDEGSGYSIGIKTLKCLSRIEDGRATQAERIFIDTLFADSTQDMSGVAFFDRYHRAKFYGFSDSLLMISKLAGPVVALALTNNDTVAKALVDDESSKLFDGVIAVVNKITLSQQDFCVHFCGGLFEECPGLADALFQRIRAKFANAQRISSLSIPKRIVGTALMGLGYNSHTDSRFDFNESCERLINRIVAIPHMNRKPL